MLRKLAILAVVCCVSIFIGALFLPAHKSDLAQHFGSCRRGAQAPPWQRLHQGWSQQAEWEFWFTSQGSQMVPYDWFIALEQADSKVPFADAKHLATLGFVSAPRGPCNPDALPLGFTLDSATGQLGLSCAACHTRLIRTKDREILVDGAPAEINFGRFVNRLFAALKHTLDDAGAWKRFAARVRPNATPQQLNALRAQVAAEAEKVRQFRHFVSASDGDFGEFAGFGRVDAFGAIFNRIAVTTLGIESNYQPANAPVNYPFLWGSARMDVTQWNGSVPNRVPFGPLARNLGEAIGLFGGVTFNADGAPGFHSPVKVGNLHAVETLIENLRAPSWVEAHLPALDAALVEQGHVIYARECERCHNVAVDEKTEPPHPFYGRECRECHADARVVASDVVGTDDLATRNYLERQAATGALNGARKWVLLGDRYGALAPTRELVITAIAGVILSNNVGSVEPQDLAALVRKRPAPDEIAGYKARPLSGIWATAPFLHNGAVPTLADLLDPPEQRPRRFRTGPLLFDAERIGLSTNTVGLPTTDFDTTQPGNSNAGHRFGTDLAASDKRALLEFLKTL